MFGLKKPLPTISRPSARCISAGTVIAALPNSITVPPTRIAFRNPSNRSAMYPPTSGVR